MNGFTVVITSVSELSGKFDVFNISLLNCAPWEYFVRVLDLSIILGTVKPS